MRSFSSSICVRVFESCPKNVMEIFCLGETNGIILLLFDSKVVIMHAFPPLPPEVWITCFCVVWGI